MLTGICGDFTDLDRNDEFTVPLDFQKCQ